jgi:hypothetical protein
MLSIFEVRISILRGKTHKHEHVFGISQGCVVDDVTHPISLRFVEYYCINNRSLSYLVGRLSVITVLQLEAFPYIAFHLKFSFVDKTNNGKAFGAGTSFLLKCLELFSTHTVHGGVGSFRIR